MPELLEFNLKAKRKPILAVPPLADPKHPFLPLEVGKKYVLADGTVVGPLVPASTTARLKWDGPTGVWSWYITDGQKNGCLDIPTHPLHIVAAYVEPTLSKEEAHTLWLKGVDIQYKAPSFIRWLPFPTVKNGHTHGPNDYSLFLWRKA